MIAFSWISVNMQFRHLPRRTADGSMKWYKDLAVPIWTNTSRWITFPNSWKLHAGLQAKFVSSLLFHPSSPAAVHTVLISSKHMNTFCPTTFARLAIPDSWAFCVSQFFLTLNFPLIFLPTSYCELSSNLAIIFWRFPYFVKDDIDCLLTTV